MAEDHLRTLVAQVAAAYFSNSHISAGDIGKVVGQISVSLAAVGTPGGAHAEEPSAAKATRVQIQNSITPEALISFEDGKPYRSLRRHLTARGLTPAQYIDKWGLPNDYPMNAPASSQARSASAKANPRIFGRGLGGKPAAADPTSPRAEAFEEDVYVPRQAEEPRAENTAAEPAEPETATDGPSAEPAMAAEADGAPAEPEAAKAPRTKAGPSGQTKTPAKRRSAAKPK